MYCKKCGKAIPENSKFCRYCGAKIAPSNDSQQHGNATKCTQDDKVKARSSVKTVVISLCLLVLVLGASLILFSKHSSLEKPSNSDTSLGSENSSYLLAGMEQDGEYNLKLYGNYIVEEDDGTIALAELMTICTMTDEEAYQILKSEPGSYYTNQGEYEEIMWSDGFLRKNSGDTFWREFWPSDSPKMEVYSSGYVFIPDDAVFIDNMSAIMFGINRDVSSLYELFHLASQDFTYDYEQIDVSVTVTNGIITIVDMYYSP